MLSPQVLKQTFLRDVGIFIELIDDMYPSICVLAIYQEMAAAHSANSLLPDITYLTVSKMSKYVTDLLDVIEPISSIQHFSNNILYSSKLLMNRLGDITVGVGDQGNAGGKMQYIWY